MSDFYDSPYVDLERDLLEELDGENYAQFVGQWAPGEPEAWERFTVMLHGDEAGDAAPATVNDLRRILAAYEVDYE